MTFVRSCAILGTFLLAALPAAAQTAGSQPPSEPESPAPLPQLSVTVTVVGTSPLPGIGITLDKLPAPAQVATDRDIRASGALDLSGFLTARLTSVFVNDIQGNPYQSDLNYRGYTASPLLGTPQGVSVYMDGVRLNQPFGDVVSWDLIARSAIASVTLMPGSNPVFGLNTLGGALVLQSKTGRTNPGTSVQTYGGSHARRAVEFEHGGSRTNGLDWFVTGNLFRDDGWRVDSASDVRQIFGRLGFVRRNSSVALTMSHADNDLTGNGLQELQLLRQDRTSIYTKPDNTKNRSSALTISLERSLTPRLMLSANAYYRHLRTATLNGDINDDSLDQSLYQPGAAERQALAAAGYTGVPASGETAVNTPFPFWRCIGNVLLQDEPGEKCNGLNNRTASIQGNEGMSAQLTRTSGATAETNLFVVGVALDRNRVDFSQSTELGYVNPDRGITGLGVFANGMDAGTVDGEPFDLAVDLTGRVRTGSVFAVDTLRLNPGWHLTLSGRFNHTRLQNSDRRNPGGGAGSLDGNHAFNRFNPAAGVTGALTSALTIYAGYSEANRAPTSIELGCADPQAPCKLPNALAGDPALEQVVARTIEAGLRGHTSRLSWSAGLFRAQNSNDILFVTSEQTGFGYFSNFNRTRRQGVELSVNHRQGRVTLGGGYTLLSATFQSDESLNGTGNSSNDAGPGLEGNIDVRPGDRLPLMPRHVLKAYADIQATPALSIDVNVMASSGVLARGNENGQHQPDGVYYLGPGHTDAYAVVNLGLRYQVRRSIQLFGQIDNALNTHYTTAAQLGETGFTSQGTFVARPFPATQGEFPLRQSTFFAPGAPTTAWGGIRVIF